LAIKPVRNGLHAYIYGRWTDKYVAFLRNKWGPQMNGLGRGWLAKRYHGKVLTPEQAAAIVTLDHDIAEQEIEQIIPYPIARKIVLSGPPDITVYECACRASKKEHCEPSQVCMVVGQPYADFVLKHHPGKSRRLGRDEALDLLKSEHERGHLHSAWFKDAMGERFYCICNCCSCCCGGIEAMTEYKSPVMISSGDVALIDTERCVGCGKCIAICPFKAITEAQSGDGGKTAVVDSSVCMGCQVCETACNKRAISFVRDATKPEPLDVRLLS
jgi:NAD-dependent dihydropyrimidine dehydrogenase PreA subunit